MKSQLVRTLLTAIFVLSLTISAIGQQPVLSDEAQIKNLRTNIQLMVANAPPKEAPNEGGHRDTLLSLRGQLLRLLLKKTGALESRIQNLQVPDALPEVLTHVAQLKKELQNVNGEIQNLDSALRQSGGTVIAAPIPPPTPEVNVKKDEKPPERAAERAAFEKAVAAISRDDLEKAALPAEAAKVPAPPCNSNGRPASTTFSLFDDSVCGLARDVTKDSRRILLEQDSYNIWTILIAKLLKSKTTGDDSYASFVSEAQEKRTDQQMGAGPTSNSATSLVSKGGIPYLLGFAVENGAAEESQKDTSITFRLNPGGLINLLAKKGFITGFQESESDAFMKFLRKTSLGFTFDTSRGSTPGIFTGSGQQLAQVSARFEFVNERDPRHKKYAEDWEKFVANEGVKLARQTWKTTIETTNFGGENDVDTFTDPALQAWLNQLNEKVAGVDARLVGVDRINAIAKVITDQADLLPTKLISEKTVAAITDFARQTQTYTKEKNKLFDKIAKGKVFTLDYVNKRGANAPDTSNFNFIAATGAGKRIDLTANGSFTFFNTWPAAPSPASPRPNRIRDFQFAGQVNFPFKVGDMGQFDFWFSGRYERLLTDASTSAGTVVPGTRGDIAFGQVGLNIPLPGLGMKFPISMTFSNRTELIKEKEVRANFGFTLNWDTIFSKLKPF